MKKVPFDKATFTVADALKAHALHNLLVEYYEQWEEAVAYEKLTGSPHPHRRLLGSTTDILATTYDLQGQLGALHKGIFYCEYTDRNFVCWWSLR